MAYHKHGQYAQAEPLYKQALAIREKIFNPDHPAIGESLNNLASLYYDQGQYADAEPLYKRSLEIAEKTYGSNHSNVAINFKQPRRVFLRAGPIRGG